MAPKETAPETPRILRKSRPKRPEDDQSRPTPPREEKQKGFGVQLRKAKTAEDKAGSPSRASPSVDLPRLKKVAPGTVESPKKGSPAPEMPKLRAVEKPKPSAEVT